jgi:hypothetical protein
MQGAVGFHQRKQLPRSIVNSSVTISTSILPDFNEIRNSEAVMVCNRVVHVLFQPHLYEAVLQTDPPPSFLDRISIPLDTTTQDNNKIREYDYDLHEIYAVVDHVHCTSIFHNIQLST